MGLHCCHKSSSFIPDTSNELTSFLRYFAVNFMSPKNVLKLIILGLLCWNLRREKQRVCVADLNVWKDFEVSIKEMMTIVTSDRKMKGFIEKESPHFSQRVVWNETKRPDNRLWHVDVSKRLPTVLGKKRKKREGSNIMVVVVLESATAILWTFIMGCLSHWKWMIRKRRRGGYNTHTGFIPTKNSFWIISSHVFYFKIKVQKNPKMDFYFWVGVYFSHT